MPDQSRPGDLEVAKDVLQEEIEAVTIAVQRVGTVIFGAVTGVVRAIGDLATDMIEIEENGRRVRRLSRQE